MYQFVDSTLYRRGRNGAKLKCIHREDGQKLLAEIHGGICGHHIGARALAGKAFRQGFFRPTALQDATAQVTKCEACQFHSKKIHQPAQALQTIPLSWPFSVWGLDILGPFPRSIGGFEYLFIAIDKFTKWPEVEPVRKVTAQSAIKFFRSIAASGSPTGSSPTTVRSSQATPSCSTPKISAPRSASLLLLIPGATV